MLKFDFPFTLFNVVTNHNFQKITTIYRKIVKVNWIVRFVEKKSKKIPVFLYLGYFWKNLLNFDFPFYPFQIGSSLCKRQECISVLKWIWYILLKWFWSILALLEQNRFSLTELFWTRWEGWCGGNFHRFGWVGKYGRNEQWINLGEMMEEKYFGEETLVSSVWCLNRVNSWLTYRLTRMSPFWVEIVDKPCA